MRRLALSFILAVAVRALGSGPTSPPAAPPASVAAGESVSPGELSAAILAETNRVRKDHGRRALRPMPALDAAADDQARFMALSLHAAHASPLYGQRTALDRVRRHGVEVGDLAENVASLPVGLATEPKAAATIAAALVSAWMKSPGHRANLLNRTFTHAGCAARLAHGFGKVDYVFGAQVFLKPAAPDLKL